MIKYIAYRCGYVEENTTAIMVWEAQYTEGFKEREEALKSLAAYLYKKYCEEYIAKPKGCCQKAKRNYCSQCGTRICKPSFNEKDFQLFIVELMNTTCDSFGGWDDYASDEMVWNPWSASIIDLTKENSICIPEDGEVSITKRVVTQ